MNDLGRRWQVKYLVSLLSLVLKSFHARQCLTHGCPVKHLLNWAESFPIDKDYTPGSVPLLGNVPFSCLWLGLSLGVFLRALHSLTLWECIRSHYDQWKCPPANLIWSKSPALSGCYFSLVSSPFCIWVLASALTFFLSTRSVRKNG